MNLDSSKKVLKLVGFLAIVAGVLGIVGGLLKAFYGSPVEGVAGYATAMNGGLVEFISGVCILIEGIFSLGASKDGKYATGAWLFACLGLFESVFSVINLITKGQLNGVHIFSIALALILSIIVDVAADTARKAHNNGTY